MYMHIDESYSFIFNVHHAVGSGKARDVMVKGMHEMLAV